MNRDNVKIMRFIFLFCLPILLLSACETRFTNQSQDLTIDLIGTSEAYCVISTPHNKYLLNAPGTTKIERDNEDLKVDCDDNFSDRRRVYILQSDISGVYFRYPEVITVDFSNADNGNRFNGFQADPVVITHQGTFEDKPTIHKGNVPAENTQVSSGNNDDFEPVIKNILTEDSFSKPTVTDQTYPVKKDYGTNRRSYPVPLTGYQRPAYEAQPEQFNNDWQQNPVGLDPSVQVFPLD